MNTLLNPIKPYQKKEVFEAPLSQPFPAGLPEQWHRSLRPGVQVSFAHVDDRHAALATMTPNKLGIASVNGLMGLIYINLYKNH